jgi:hypothetical protein
MVNADIVSNVKLLMRISEDDNSFDLEIEDLVMQCRDDLLQAGILESFLDFTNNTFLELDGNIRACLVLYVKALFGIGDSANSGWFIKQYNYRKGTVMNQQKYKYSSIGETV